jgi:hypothetical protein
MEAIREDLKLPLFSHGANLSDSCKPLRFGTTPKMTRGRRMSVHCSWANARSRTMSARCERSERTKCSKPHCEPEEELFVFQTKPLQSVLRPTTNKDRSNPDDHRDGGQAPSCICVAIA